MAFGDWLREELARREMSMSELARRVGVSPGTVSRWVSNERKPDYRSCEVIARAFEYKPEFVLAQAGYQSIDLDREQQLLLDRDRVLDRLAVIDREIKSLQREQEDLVVRFEEVNTELERLEAERKSDKVEVALKAIDDLPLAESVKDHLRIQVLDAMERTGASPRGDTS
jgi:transcriptional regulator with XRE-family HTH domain